MTPNEGDITLIPFSVWFINMNSRYINTKIVNVNVNWFKYSLISVWFENNAYVS